MVLENDDVCDITVGHNPSCPGCDITRAIKLQEVVILQPGTYEAAESVEVARAA
jgi:hypothetical protein